jgi:hypothetical protein
MAEFWDLKREEIMQMKNEKADLDAYIIVDIVNFL